MNQGFHSWPLAGLHRDRRKPSIFPGVSLPGSTTRFFPHVVLPTAGAAVPHAWRAVNNGHTTTVSVEDGALCVDADPEAAPGTTGGAAHLLVHGDVDVLLAVSGQPPSQFSSTDTDSWQFGVFLGETGVAGAGCGFTVYCPAASEAGTTLSYETGLYALPLDTFSPDDVEMTPAVGLPALRVGGLGLFRLKRRGVDVRAYYSQDGVSWVEGPSGANRQTVASGGSLALGVACAASMTTPAGTVKARLLEIKFLDPTTAFPS